MATDAQVRRIVRAASGLVLLLLLLLAPLAAPVDGTQRAANTAMPDDDLNDAEPVNFQSKQSPIVRTAIRNFNSLLTQKNAVARSPLSADRSRPLRFGVLFNDNPADMLVNKATILAAIQLAVERACAVDGPLPNFTVAINYRNTRESSVYGPLEAMEMHIKHTPDVYLGPINDYVLAPVARYALVWNTPIISPGGTSDGFRLKAANFPMLTSMRPSCKSMVPAVLDVMRHFGWRHVSMMYQNDLKLKGKGDSHYSFQMGSLFNYARDVLDFAKTSLQLDADDMAVGHAKYVEYLQLISNMSRSEWWVERGWVGVMWVVWDSVVH